MNKEQVPLRQEIENLEHYIALQKLRLKDSNIIKFSCIGNTSHKEIPPMILLPLVENAFKHADLNKEVKIEIHVEGSAINLFCQNYIGEKDHPEESQGGIGLENIKRRLTILSAQHTINTTCEGSKFTVNLTIQS